MRPRVPVPRSGCEAGAGPGCGGGAWLRGGAITAGWESRGGGGGRETRLSDFIPPPCSWQLCTDVLPRGLPGRVSGAPSRFPGGGAVTTWQGLASTWRDGEPRGLGGWARRLPRCQAAEGGASLPAPGSPCKEGRSLPVTAGSLRQRVRWLIQARRAGFALSLEGWERPARLEEGGRVLGGSSEGKSGEVARPGGERPHAGIHPPEGPRGFAGAGDRGGRRG